jgi:hypothetical protein
VSFMSRPMEKSKTLSEVEGSKTLSFRLPGHGKPLLNFEP